MSYKISWFNAYCLSMHVKYSDYTNEIEMCDRITAHWMTDWMACSRVAFATKSKSGSKSL